MKHYIGKQVLLGFGGHDGIGNEDLRETEQPTEQDNMQSFKEYIGNPPVDKTDVFEGLIEFLMSLQEENGVITNTFAIRMVTSIRKDYGSLKRTKNIDSKINYIGRILVQLASLLLLILATSGDMKSKSLISKVFSLGSIIKSLRKK